MKCKKCKHEFEPKCDCGYSIGGYREDGGLQCYHCKQNYRWVKCPECGEAITKAGCYIATCVYGSYDCPEVWVLRRHRDYNLQQKRSGRFFIKLYYAIAPTVIKIFGKHNWFNRYWKKRLDKKVAKLKEKGFDDSPYND